MEKRAKKKRVGRPEGRRPVIAMRVHPDLYKDLAASAEKRKITLAEDAANRLRQSFDWDKAFGDTRKMMADHDKVLEGGRDSALRQWGFQPVIGRPGHWVETDKIKPEQMLALDPALENFIERIVERTLQRLAK